MDNMSAFIQHNISIMPIFDLQQKSNNAVGSHRTYEVPPGILQYICKIVKRCDNASQSGKIFSF